MNVNRIVALLVAGLFATAAFSGQQVHSHVKIVVIDSDDAGETRIELDSDDLDFDLADMQVGENQSVIDKDGRSVLITRVQDGFTFDVNGKTITMPAIDQLGGGQLWIDGGDVDSDVDVRVMRSGMSDQSMSLDGVMIISSEEIDAATQSVIRAALESAGHSDVSFAAGRDGQHQVHVIKKVVRNTL
jgi:hypothetical protein